MVMLLEQSASNAPSPAGYPALCGDIALLGTSQGGTHPLYISSTEKPNFSLQCPIFCKRCCADVSVHWVAVRNELRIISE